MYDEDYICSFEIFVNRCASFRVSGITYHLLHPGCDFRINIVVLNYFYNGLRSLEVFPVSVAKSCAFDVVYVNRIICSYYIYCYELKIR
jgi:hypothetical protein